MSCWLVFWLWVGCLVNGSIGYWIPSSVVWWDGGSLCWSAILWSVGRLVGQVFGGFVCRPFVQITSGSFGWSIVWLCLAHGQSVGQSVAWAVDGLVEWLMALLVCRSVVCLLS